MRPGKSAGFLFLFLFFQYQTFAQLNKWLVRETSGQIHLVDFTTPTPTVSIPSPGLGNGGLEDVNVMTDVNSNILFTTGVEAGNTIIVKDANWNTMPNGTGLHGNISTLSSALCRRPCTADQYFFVHYVSQNWGIQDTLYYSIIDMSLNGGMGDVSQKNILLGSGYSEGMAVSHQLPTGCRWLLVGGITNNAYSVVRFLISDIGISGPTVIGTYAISGTPAGRPMKVTLAHDNSKVAISTLNTTSSNADVVVWDFDLLTGTLSNQQLLNISTNAVLGIEFSPDNSKLYYLTNVSSPPAQLGRVDLITGSVQQISNSMGAYANDIQLAGNGKLYISWNYSGDYLSEIANPNSPTIAGVGFTSQAVLISNSGCRPGLPNAIDGEPPGTTTTPQFIEFTGESTLNCNEYTFKDSTCLGTWREWNFGDGTYSNLEVPVHQYLIADTFDVSLRVLACGDTIVLTKPDYIITTSGNPQAQFTYVDSVCAATAVPFLNQSSGANNYIWDFGDGDSSALTDPTHSYLVAGTYTVTLIVSASSCQSDTIQHQVIIIPSPPVIADFDYLFISCNDTIILTDQSAGAVSWLWDFGDGTFDTVADPVHSYTSPGNYVITLIAANLCGSDTMHQQVIAGQQEVVASFSVSDQPCSFGVNIANHSQNALLYNWDFDDGFVDSIANPVHAYTSPGTYNITLITSNTCGSDTTRQEVIIEPLLPSLAQFDADTQLCKTMVSFINNSTDGFSYFWDFGDGTKDTAENPVHEFAVGGEYTTTLIVNQGTPCSDTAVEVISIDFTAETNLFIPNAFTPNSDKLNEIFIIYTGKCDKEYELYIYNRWGEMLYHVISENPSWDGYYNGELVAGGVYVYLLKGNEVPVCGSVTVVR